MMFTTLFVFCLIGFGVSRMLKFVKNNPGQSIQAASLLKRWLGM